MPEFLKEFFTLRAPNMSLREAVIYTALAGIFFVASVLVYRKAHAIRKNDSLRARGIQRLGRWFFGAGALLLVWTFLAYERISIFGARLWLVVFDIVWIVWLAFIVWYFVKTVPSRSAAARERAEKEKYLPKKIGN